MTTKHEKALLILLAYIIGFTAAYIAFVQLHSSDNPGAKGVETSEVSGAEKQSANAISAILMEDGLYAVIEGKERIVSAKNTTDHVLGAGFHYDIGAFETSPNNAYLYYCEQDKLTPPLCNAYMYAAAEDVVYRVMVGDEQVTVQTDDDVIWLTDGRLVLNGYKSVSVEQPWIVEMME